MSRALALGAILVGAGILWLLSLAGTIELSYETWIGVLLVAIGLTIALTPGRHGLLAVAGVVVALAGVPALVVDHEVFSGDIGDAVETPLVPSDLATYRHGVGKLTVDLTSPGLRPGPVAVEASVGIGELLVIVPRAADVTVDAHVGVGNIDALGRTKDGVGVDLKETFTAPGRQQLSLDLETGMGDVRVERR
jgi:predicted membrane protein